MSPDLGRGGFHGRSCVTRQRSPSGREWSVHCCRPHPLAARRLQRMAGRSPDRFGISRVPPAGDQRGQFGSQSLRQRRTVLSCLQHGECLGQPSRHVLKATGGQPTRNRIGEHQPFSLAEPLQMPPGGCRFEREDTRRELKAKNQCLKGVLAGYSAHTRGAKAPNLNRAPPGVSRGCLRSADGSSEAQDYAASSLRSIQIELTFSDHLPYRCWFPHSRSTIRLTPGFNRRALRMPSRDGASTSRTPHSMAGRTSTAQSRRVADFSAAPSAAAACQAGIARALLR